MRVNEFVEKFETNIDLNTILEIRTYVPIAEKRAILETIIDRCFTVEDGVLTCDYVLKKMMFELAMIKYHTDLEVDIMSEDDYDELQKTGANIHWGYETDYREFKSLFEGMECELHTQYSIESSIVRLTDKLSNSLDGFTNIITQKIDGFDMSKFGFEDIELNQFKDLLSKYGK